MAHPSEYQKTPARWRGLLLGGSLWLAEDHLLSVRSMRFSEEYKRYYYRDIQALQVRHGARWWCPSWLIGALFALVLASLIFSVARRFPIAGGCEVTLFLLLGLIAYRSLAQGCFCYVVTAVATDELIGIRTRSKAKKTIAVIAARITAAQGAMPPDWELAMANSAETLPPPLSWKPAPAPEAIDSQPAPAPSLGVWAAVVALLSTLGDGLITLAEMRHWPLPDWLGMTNVGIGVAAAVTAIVLLRHVKSLYWLRNVALASVLFMGGATYLAYTINTINTNLPSSPARRLLTQAHQGLGFLNIGGDFAMLGLAATFWLRRRSAAPAHQTLASTGEF